MMQTSHSDVRFFVVSETPIYVAAELGDAAMVELLAWKGSDVNLKNNYGWSPAHIGVCARTLETLLAFDCDFEAVDADERTPIMTAVDWAWFKKLPLLLDLNVDTLKPSVDNRTVSQTGDVVTRNLLLMHRQKPVRATVFI